MVECEEEARSEMAPSSKRSWQVAKVFNNAWMCTPAGSAQ